MTVKYAFNTEDERFAGGRIFVYPEDGGWTTEHQPAGGAYHPCDWHRRKNKALNYARQRAEAFGARLFVEEAV